MGKVRVLFVCLGNICRSPTAHGVFAALVQSEGLADTIEVSSAATSDWHTGNSPDSRSIAAGRERGFDISLLRAKQVRREDFSSFDYILAMDEQNLMDLQVLAPDDHSGEVKLLLSFDASTPEQEVPDPYYGGVEGFESVVDLIDSASHALLAHIREHKLPFL